MTFRYDKDANALYIKLSDSKIVQTLTLDNNVFIDIGSDNRPVGLEVLFSGELDSKVSKILQPSN